MRENSTEQCYHYDSGELSIIQKPTKTMTIFPMTIFLSPIQFNLLTRNIYRVYYIFDPLVITACTILGDKMSVTSPAPHHQSSPPSLPAHNLNLASFTYTRPSKNQNLSILKFTRSYASAIVLLSFQTFENIDKPLTYVYVYIFELAV